MGGLFDGVGQLPIPRPSSPHGDEVGVGGEQPRPNSASQDDVEDGTWLVDVGGRTDEVPGVEEP